MLATAADARMEYASSFFIVTIHFRVIRLVLQGPSLTCYGLQVSSHYLIH
jgi:hypothetical protein